MFCWVWAIEKRRPGMASLTLYRGIQANRPAAVLLLILAPAVAEGQGVLAPSQPRQTASLTVLAARDVKGLPPTYQYEARYLMLDTDNVGLNEVEDVYRVMCGHVHHLSTQPGIAPLKIIPGSQGRLFRLFLADYGWKRETWEKLVDVSPQTHVDLDVRRDVIESEVKYVVEWWPKNTPWKDGIVYQKPFQYYKELRIQRRVASDTRRERALAPWLIYGPGGKEALADLVKYTQSKVPMVDARWFFNQTAIQKNRVAGYYDWLGIKDEKTFREVIGFDEKLAEKFGADLREAVGESTVTLKPRGFSFKNAIGGGYRRSFDFEVPTNKRNPQRVLGKDIENHYDASEQFGSLPNGFFATGVFAGPDAKDAAGKPIKAGTRADFAPPDIASDGDSVSVDKRVHVNISCYRCHANAGVQTLEVWWRNLVQPPIALKAYDPVKAREVRAQYGKSIDSYQNRDRATFDEAVKEATGWDANTYLRKYAIFWSSYEDAKIDLAWAAREVRVSERHLRLTLDARLKAGNLDEVVAVLLLEGRRARRLEIRQFEEVYPLLKEYLAPKDKS